MSPELLTLLGVLGAAAIGSAATLFTVKATRRKVDAEADTSIVGAAKSVVAMLHDELDAMTAKLKAETARCDGLARRVEHLERQLAQGQV